MLLWNRLLNRVILIKVISQLAITMPLYSPANWAGQLQPVSVDSHAHSLRPDCSGDFRAPPAPLFFPNFTTSTRLISTSARTSELPRAPPLKIPNFSNFRNFRAQMKAKGVTVKDETKESKSKMGKAASAAAAIAEAKDSEAAQVAESAF